MRFDIVTLFPEIFNALNYGVIGRAIKNDLIQLKFWNPRDYTHDNYGKVDDRSYGGGPGMVMLIEPLSDAINAAKQDQKGNKKVILLTPQGKFFNQETAKEMATNENLILVTGRYEGIDERLIESMVDEEWSIGDYVLSGGELAVMVVIDAVTRLLPNVLGDECSAVEDSFMDGLLDCPHYTRPEIFNGQKVPNVLLSGNHKAILEWRLMQKLGRTFLRRPDLLENRDFTELEKKLLQEFIEINSREAK
jgi:tRNA (guanine37-N1)-methyltransferase